MLQTFLLSACKSVVCREISLTDLFVLRFSLWPYVRDCTQGFTLGIYFGSFIFTCKSAGGN